MALGAIQIAFWAIYRAKAGGHWDPEEHKEGNENAGAEEKAAEA